ncbi:RNA polymerase recycling motor HelD [Levilactobacillus bambusae]|uniref:ATP-dependent DNA helicase n=1 Tax=Levilactobacillus bambusae TaxID=2024736 RepID=A0A2V1MWS9_9LACO|nr:RNA polymerase recycling motor HelD [Levilactobacillus bambusae]PWF99341.1 ATP-dependent DNA helicase [Levilactobacillus bambusae]
MDDEQKQEQARVDSVINKISDRIETTTDEYEKAHAEKRDVQKNYRNNTSVNWFEIDDRIDTSAELQQQRALESRLNENESIIKNQLERYQILEKSPYFGRIDIQDPDESQPERLYIGTSSFVDDDQNFLIYDWRAPVSSIYYNGVLGQVAYETPAGSQTTDLQKKRQYLIQNGHIENMFDTNETVGDEMLQHVLGEQNDDTMQNIVATIQREQNDIIRDTRSDLLVVQGAAGSGKTSAILQRIAFLLYHSRRELEADQIVLFSPNKLFSHYISDVLPSLGERNMAQVTLAEFFNERFEGLHVQSLFDRYEADQTHPGDAHLRDYKEGAEFMATIRDYCRNLKTPEMAFTDILFDGRIFFSHGEIKALYETLPNVLPVDRFLQLKNALIKQLKARIDVEAKKDWVQDAIDNLSTEEYHTLLGSKRRHQFQQLDDEVAYIAHKLVKDRLRSVYDAIYNGYFLDTYQQYNAFLNQCSLPENVSQSSWQQSISDYHDQIEYHRLNLIDAAPLLYLRDQLLGGGTNSAIQFLFIDEMQDYSLAQLLYLHHAFPRAKLTFLGDSEQALFKDVEEPEAVLRQLNEAFHVKKSRLITLNRSYRSTYPITTFAKSLLPDGDRIEAFNRPGDLPKLIIRYDHAGATRALIREVQTELAESSVCAILTKNLTEARQVYQEIHGELDQVTLLTDMDRSLPKGAVVLPIYLAKGLEFDSVIAYDVSAQNYPDASLTGTLYTIATRAMHHLTLLSIGPVSPLIATPRIPAGQLQIEHELNN